MDCGLGVKGSECGEVVARWAGWVWGGWKVCWRLGVVGGGCMRGDGVCGRLGNVGRGKGWEGRSGRGLLCDGREGGVDALDICGVVRDFIADGV